MAEATAPIIKAYQQQVLQSRSPLAKAICDKLWTTSSMISKYPAMFKPLCLSPPHRLERVNHMARAVTYQAKALMFHK